MIPKCLLALELIKKGFRIYIGSTETIDRVAKQRSKARSELLKNLNPIIKDYMQKNNIRVVLDKKSLLVADENLDITKEIM